MSVGVLLVLTALLVVPGTGLALLLFPPNEMALITRAALVIPLGYVLVVLVAFTLAIAGVLTTALVVPLLVGATAAIWFVALRRHSLRAYAGEWASEIRGDRWGFALLAVLLLAFAVVRWTYGPSLSFHPTSLRYWADGLEVADAHGVPAATLQWDVLLPPTTSKIALNVFHATASFVAGRDGLRQMGALLFLNAMALFLLAYALARELGLRRTAPLVALLLFANQLIGCPELTGDLNRPIAESWGRLIALAAVLLTVRALHLAYGARRERSGPAKASWISATEEPEEHPQDPGEAAANVPADAASEIDAGEDAHDGGKSRLRRLVGSSWQREALLAGVILAIAAGTHLVPTAVVLGFLACLGLATVLVRRAARPMLAVGALVALTAIIGGACILLLPRGDLGFEGAAGDAAYERLRNDLGLPQSFDPTYYITRGFLHQSPSQLARLRPTPQDVVRTFVVRVTRQEQLRTGWGGAALVALIAGTVLALLIVLIWGSPQLRIVALGAIGLALVLVLAALGFAEHYDLYALARFGVRRLFDYAGMPFVFLGAAVIETGLDGLDRVRVRAGRGAEPVGSSGAVRAEPPRPDIAAPRAQKLGPAGVIALVLAVALAVVLLPRATAPRADEEIARQEIALVKWVSAQVPCDGRILANRRTLATWEVVGHRAGVLEGMGPHVRPDVLERTVREQLQARAFFLDPAAHENYLRDRGVSAIVVTHDDHTIAGWRPIADVDTAKLDAMPFLRKIRDDDVATVYKVVGEPPAPGLPSVADAPGYDC